MKTFFCLFILIFTSSFALSDSFKIDSYYYTDSAPKPNETGSKVIFHIDSEVSCQGNKTNKIFISKDSYGVAPTVYYLTQFWPSYFLKQAALLNADIHVDFGFYDETLDACEISFNYDGYSQHKWYEPHEFTISDIDDTNPINKVSYQLYVNSTSPSYAMWVYADTDYSVDCDGMTTNRIIPTTSPDEFGRTVTKEYRSQVSPHYSSENTRSFFDLLGGKIDQYTVGSYVAALNGCMIYNIEYSENSISSEAIEIGKQQCIENPEACNLFSREELDLAIQVGLDDGITQCIDSPESCGLFNQVDVDNALLSGEIHGKEACMESPETCGLFGQINIDEALNTGEVSGKAKCIDNPASCELFNLEEVNLAVDQNLSEAIKEITDSLTKGILESICKQSSDSILCVNIDIDKAHYDKEKHHKHKKYHGQNGHDHSKNKKGHGHEKHDHDKYKKRNKH